ncbi:hypothetical protein [Brevibacillus migulae]|uniref:hypothetical protein n=1 Tax=Brevibacillus migulae TaxID=1644114 RepID=UPI00106E76AF|nr:hypothetical protein [Brevibacillus migulae]
MDKQQKAYGEIMSALEENSCSTDCVADLIDSVEQDTRLTLLAGVLKTFGIQDKHIRQFFTIIQQGS